MEVGCDDGNRTPGDGCDDNCRVEEGFLCWHGDFDSPDLCTEECGDRRNMRFKDCDDGNLDSYDGCDGDCNIETGWICLGGDSRGPQPTQDFCVEVCGDGFN